MVPWRPDAWRVDGRPRGRGQACATFVVRVGYDLVGSVLVHPGQAVGGFFVGEYFACVFLDAAVAFPQAARFLWVLESRAKVRNALLAERFLQNLEVFSITAWNGRLDVDGTVHVLDRSAYAAGEASAYL